MRFFFAGPRAQLHLDSLQGPIKQLTSLVSKEILVFVEVFNKPKQQHEQKKIKKKTKGADGEAGEDVEGSQTGLLQSPAPSTIIPWYPETKERW